MLFFALPVDFKGVIQAENQVWGLVNKDNAAGTQAVWNGIYCYALSLVDLLFEDYL